MELEVGRNRNRCPERVSGRESAEVIQKAVAVVRMLLQVFANFAVM